MVFNNNIRYFIKLSGLKQKYIASKLDMAESTISRLTKNQIPKRKSSLIKIAHFCSEVSKIPFSEFENGQALLSKDFSKILENLEQDLPLKKVSNQLRSQLKVMADKSATPDQKLTIEEINFNIKLRKIYASEDVPLPSDYLDKIVECLALTRLDMDLIDTFIQLARYIKSRGISDETNRRREGTD